jgi:hypothetical protein
MDTVNLVLLALTLLLLSNIATVAWALRERYRAKTAQRENERMQQRYYAASYNTGLVEHPIVQVLEQIA